MHVFGINPRQIDFSIFEGTKDGLENNRSFLAGFGGSGVPLSTLFTIQPLVSNA